MKISRPFFSLGENVGINWARTILIAVAIPILAVAAIGGFAIAGDAELRALGHEMSRVTLFMGERIGYGALTFVAVFITYVATRARRDRWWIHNGEVLGTERLQEKYRVCRRERNQFEYRLKVRTRELREERARVKAAHERLGAVAVAAGQAQLALTAPPDEEQPDIKDVQILRRVN